MMKEKEKVLMLCYQPEGKITFYTTVSASTNLATELFVFSPSWKGSPPSFSITHFKSTFKASDKPPETNITLQDPEVSEQQAKMNAHYSNLCQSWASNFQLLEPDLNTFIYYQIQFYMFRTEPCPKFAYVNKKHLHLNRF